VCVCVCVLVDEIAAVVSRTGRPVTLGCVISTSERIRADIEWFKDDEKIVDDGGEHYAISRNETKSLLNITRVCESYTCHLFTCINTQDGAESYCHLQCSCHRKTNNAVAYVLVRP